MDPKYRRPDFFSGWFGEERKTSWSGKEKIKTVERTPNFGRRAVFLQHFG